MREYELTIADAIKKGLSPELNLPFNAQFLYQALGFRCGRAGIEPYVLGIDPAIAGIHYLWPYPQFIVGEKYNILVVRDTAAAEDTVYSINDSNAILAIIAHLDIATYGIGWLMEVADFGEYAFMVNGVAMIYWDVVGGVWAVTTGTSLIPLLGTVCNFKGQLVGGNVQSAWYDCDSSSYIWSKIGSADMTPSDDNEAGYRRCPYGGTVYHVRRLGDAVVGYSSKGITLLKPVNEPAPTFGFLELSDIGLINRGAINGNLQRQVYVGSDYVVREITSEGIKELGYQWLMETLIGQDIIVSYDPTKRDFYIGNATKTYLLSPIGMTEIQQHPSAVWSRNKVVYTMPGTKDTGDSALTSWQIDFEYSGQKTIQTVELSGGGFVNATAAAEHLNNQNWVIGNYSPVNLQGIATVVASGDAFKIRVKFGTVSGSFRLLHIKTRYKMTDLRGIRGVYAPPLRGQ